MFQAKTTLSKFLIDQLDGNADSTSLSALLVDIAAAIKAISAVVSKGALGDHLGTLPSENIQGEQQKKLDVITNEIMLRQCEWGGLLSGMVSEELDEVFVVHGNGYGDRPHGAYLLSFDPLDGSSNIDVNVAVGTIFSILRHREPKAPTAASFLRPGREQVAAGYAIYGPSTMLVLSVGRGTHGFTLDRETGNFVLTHPDLMIPADTGEFAINVSNERFWEPPVMRYVDECKAGRSGVRERDFNMRWIAAMVADVHRILMRGGVYLYPRDSRQPLRAGRLRLLYEAAPMAMLIEQAGGLASTGHQRLSDVEPEDIHQRCSVILGSRNEVERIERYHREHDCGEDRPYVSPLFNERSLYRPELI